MSEPSEEEEKKQEEREAEAAPEPASEPAPEPVPVVKAEAKPLEVLGKNLRLFDFTTKPDTKAGWAVRIVVTVIAFAVLVQRTKIATAPLVAAKPPIPITTEDVEGYRFRLPEHTRHAIFDDLAAAELAERDRAIKGNTWNGHLWSREDDRGHYERVAARGAAAKYKVSLSQVYLVLDEGIREHWPAPNGQPLPATTPPLSLRSTW